jgi:hypothetical protein
MVLGPSFHEDFSCYRTIELEAVLSGKREKKGNSMADGAAAGIEGRPHCYRDGGAGSSKTRDCRQSTGLLSMEAARHRRFRPATVQEE